MSSLGITHHVFPTSSLFFGGKKTLNRLAGKEAEGTAGLFQERRPLRELWDTCKEDNLQFPRKNQANASLHLKRFGSLFFVLTPKEIKNSLPTPRNPSLLLVMESRSRGCIVASTENVSPSGSFVSSSSKSTVGMIPSEGKKENSSWPFM